MYSSPNSIHLSTFHKYLSKSKTFPNTIPLTNHGEDIHLVSLSKIPLNIFNNDQLLNIQNNFLLILQDFFNTFNQMSRNKSPRILNINRNYYILDNFVRY